MGDFVATEASARRRRAARRSASLKPADGEYAAAGGSSVTANVSGVNGRTKRNCSLERTSKSDKKRRRGDPSERLR